MVEGWDCKEDRLSTNTYGFQEGERTLSLPLINGCGETVIPLDWESRGHDSSPRSCQFSVQLLERVFGASVLHLDTEEIGEISVSKKHWDVHRCSVEQGILDSKKFGKGWVSTK